MTVIAGKKICFHLVRYQKNFKDNQSICTFMIEIIVCPVTFVAVNSFRYLMRYFTTLFLLLVLVTSSCKKEGPEDGVVKGTKKIIVTVKHHSRILPGITVYLKYNATEFPGADSTLYDWNKTSDVSGVAVFEDLFDGNYFLYGKGIDEVIHLEVIGGATLLVNNSTTVNDQLEFTLMVTE